MHQSALDKMQAFVDGYLGDLRDQPLEFLEVGSMVAEGGQASQRNMMESSHWRYTGMDVAKGHNVDVVVKNPYHWAEFADGSFDVVVSSQVFEHVQYFWHTAMEIARVLKPGGLCCIVAPSSGEVHRFPYDCWRFYPDGLPAVFDYAGLDLLTSYVQPPHLYSSAAGDKWLDACIVAHRPVRGKKADEVAQIRGQLSRLLLQPKLTLADVHAVSTGKPVNGRSILAGTDDPEAFTRLEGRIVGAAGPFGRKRRAVKHHLRAAWRVLTKSL